MTGRAPCSDRLISLTYKFNVEVDIWEDQLRSWRRSSRYGGLPLDVHDTIVFVSAFIRAIFLLGDDEAAVLGRDMIPFQPVDDLAIPDNNYLHHLLPL